MRIFGRFGVQLGMIAAALVVGIGSAVADPVKIRLGYGAAAEEPIWLLVSKRDIAQNYGKAYTLDATLFTSSSQRAQAFEAGAIDLASGSANGVIFAAAEGVKAKIIATLSRESKRAFSTAYYVLDSSPIKTVADLKGKTVGINGFSTSGHLWLKAALEKNNLTDTDVTIAPIAFPAMEEALKAGKIDIGEFPQPFAAMLEKNVKVRKIFDAKYGVPFDEELIVLIGKDEFLKKNADAVRAMLVDLKAATKYYIDNPREARKALIDAKMVRVTPDVYIGMEDYYHEPTLAPSVENLQHMQELQMKSGFQKKSADVSSLVDLSYLPK